jgi:hypothetical protein
MKNLWKGLIVGACTGAGIGLVADALAKSGQVGHDLAVQGRDKLADAHLGARAQDVASDVADSVRSDLAPAAKVALASATKTVKEDVAPKIDAAAKAVREKVAD